MIYTCFCFFFTPMVRLPFAVLSSNILPENEVPDTHWCLLAFILASSYVVISFFRTNLGLAVRRNPRVSARGMFVVVVALWMSCTAVPAVFSSSSRVLPCFELPESLVCPRVELVRRYCCIPRMSTHTPAINLRTDFLPNDGGTDACYFRGMVLIV